MSEGRRPQGERPLAALLAYMASQKKGAQPGAGLAGPEALAAPRRGGAARPGLDEPAQLDYFRSLWAGVNANRQVRQSQEQVPDNAGPLHSSHLVHRSLSLMRGLSPGYLQCFLGHLEALTWLDKLGESETGKEGVRAGAARKGARSR